MDESVYVATRQRPQSHTASRRRYLKNPKLRTYLRATVGVLVAGGIAAGAWPAIADSATFKIRGTGNLKVAYAADRAGVCNGDHERLSSQANLEYTLARYPVGEDIPFNRATVSSRVPADTTVADAEATYLIAALYHRFARGSAQDDQEAASFAWAVQTQLNSWGRHSTKPPADGGIRGRQMLAEARQMAGPHRLSLAFSVEDKPITEPTVPQSQDQIYLTGLQVRGAHGFIEQLPIELELEGAASFDSGRKRAEITSGLQAQRLKVKVEQPGSVRVKARVRGLPSHHLEVFEIPQAQDLLTAPPQAGVLDEEITVTFTAPQPAPEPEPSPTPTPTPQPEPDATPQPQPSPTHTPAPTPHPQPSAEPTAPVGSAPNLDELPGPKPKLPTDPPLRPLPSQPAQPSQVGLVNSASSGSERQLAKTGATALTLPAVGVLCCGMGLTGLSRSLRRQ